MKKILLTVVMALAVSFMVNAQTPKKINPFTVEGLDLVKATDEQKKQVMELTKQHLEKIAALRKDTTLTAEARLAAHRKLNVDRSLRLYNEILNAEQSTYMKKALREQRTPKNDKEN